MAFGNHMVVDLVFKSNEQQYLTSRLYYKPDGGLPDIGEAVNIAQGIYDFFKAPIKACLPVATFFLEVRTRWHGPDTEWEVSNQTGGDQGTILADEFHTEEAAVVIRRNTGKPGRSKRGRVFIPFVPETLCSQGSLLEAGMEKYMLVALAMQTRLESVSSYGWVPQQPDWKNNVLEPVQYCAVVQQLCSRKDRRNPKVLIARTVMESEA